MTGPPGSDLTIDKFVYDPKRKSGQVAATFTKGVMRFVGGKIFKAEGGVKINTPAGSLAIRGGMFLGNVKGSRGVFLFLYGDEMRLKRPNGEVLRTVQSGYKIDTSFGVEEITAKDVHFFMQAFSKGVVKQAGSKGKGGDRRITPGSNTEADIKNDAAYSRILGDIPTTQAVNTPTSPEPPNGGPPPPPPPTGSGPPFGWGAGGTPRCSPNCTDPQPNG